jgi:hypothetical protein
MKVAGEYCWATTQAEEWSCRGRSGYSMFGVWILDGMLWCVYMCVYCIYIYIYIYKHTHTHTHTQGIPTNLCVCVCVYKAFQPRSKSHLCIYFSIFMIIFDFRKIRLLPGPTECVYSASLFYRKLLRTITCISQTFF